MESLNFEDVVLKRLEDLATKVDDIRVTHLPQIKLDVQKDIAAVKLDVQRALSGMLVDVGGLKAKAAVVGGAAGLVGTGIITAILAKMGIH